MRLRPEKARIHFWDLFTLWVFCFYKSHAKTKSNYLSSFFNRCSNMFACLSHPFTRYACCFSPNVKIAHTISKKHADDFENSMRLSCPSARGVQHVWGWCIHVVQRVCVSVTALVSIQLCGMKNWEWVNLGGHFASSHSGHPVKLSYKWAKGCVCVHLEKALMFLCQWWHDCTRL